MIKNLKADVTIISAGTAGLIAAITAAQGGASVIVFEKSAHIGGTGRMAGGLFAVESSFQDARQLSLTREEVFDIYMKFTHWRVNGRLVKTLFDMSADTIDWLQSLGVEFLDVFAHGKGNYYTWHVVKGPCGDFGYTGAAATMMKILTEKAKALGVKFYTKTPVTGIIKDGERITGVKAKDESGNEFHTRSKAVIVATGGYSIGSVPGMPGGIGDGIRLAKAAGAAVKEVEPEKLIIMGKMPPRQMGMHMSRVYQIIDQPILFVNLMGERFMNEDIVLSPIYPGNIISRQPEQHGFGIFDVDTAKYYFNKGTQSIGSGPSEGNKRVTDFKAEITKIRKEQPNSIADSLEELCCKTGIDLNGLQETLKEYNKACETGRDGAFNKQVKYLMAVKRPPFFVAMRNGNSALTWNGIKVNYRTEVLTPEFKVIPGLYAAGMDIADELLHDTYPFMFPGTAMGFAVNSGRLSAENALNYINR